MNGIQGAATTAPIRVLVVDDHAPLRDVVCARLAAQAGVDVAGIAATAAEALARVRQDRLDVVVTDLMLPDLNGMSTVREILRHAPHVRVIVYTLHSDARYVSRMIEAGVSGYVAKDDNLGELVSAVHRVMAGSLYLSASVRRAMATRGRRLRTTSPPATKETAT